VKEPEYNDLATFALANKIPFVSANYPNDGGVRSNPYLAILQSTLRSHCEAIHSFLIQNHGNDKIFIVRPSGSQEDKVSAYLKKANEPDGKPLLKMETIRIDSNFNALVRKLDSNRTSIIIAGSLDADFAENITAAINPLQKKYPLKLIGMPNWEGFDIVRKGRYPQVPFYFTSSFYPDKKHSAALYLENKYREKYKGLPSEAAFRGFEAMFYFSKLISSHPSNCFSKFDEMEESVFNGYNFKAVYNQKSRSVPDYYENEHIYLLKSLNGNVNKAW
jgi:hypothetical protein